MHNTSLSGSGANPLEATVIRQLTTEEIDMNQQESRKQRNTVTYGELLEQAIYREAVKQIWIDRLKILFLVVAIGCGIRWFLS